MGERLAPDGLVYVALTGTPRPKSLELFGQIREDSCYEAFHTYHLGTAVSEGRVMNPIKDYNQVSACIRTTKDSNDITILHT